MFTSDLITRALAEDIGVGDITSEALIPDEQVARGTVVAKQKLVMAGSGIAGAVFVSVDPGIRINQLVSDGKEVGPMVPVMLVEGKCLAILKAERVALNFLQRLCGIATLTRAYVDRTRGTKAKILDTRKTVPLFRHLDKYAVRLGGGVNHRFGLYDGYLIKDNHIIAVDGLIREAVGRVLMKDPAAKVIVEVTSVEQAIEAKAAGASRLLLDNMTDEKIAETLRTVPGIETEVSGGVTLDRVQALAALGVDYISVGALTHSPKAADLSLELELL